MQLVGLHHLFLHILSVVFGEGLIELEDVFVDGDFLLELDGNEKGVLDDIVFDGIDDEVGRGAWVFLFLNHILI